MYLGAHLGIAEGLGEAVRTARAIGGEAIQIFSKSPQMWSGPPLSAEAAAEFRAAVQTEGLRASHVHHGYLINLASPKRAMLGRSRKAFLDEVHRAELLGVDGLIFHPGAHLSSGTEAGVRTIIESLTKTLEAVPEGRVRLLLENAAGQGTAMCSTFEELASVLHAVGPPSRVGVCLDTCHLFAAGVDFTTESGYGTLVDRIEATFGCAAVGAFHLNDAKAELGSHLDRHENIGKGRIGAEGFRSLVNDARWEAVPGYLETPLDERGYARYAEDLLTLQALRPPMASGVAPARPARRGGASRSSTVK